MLLPIADVKRILESNNINISGVFHIGAHTCEELSMYSELGIRPESVIWVDALEYNVMNAKERGIPNVFTATITDKDDEDIVFNITNNVCSSSVLELGTHIEEHPYVVYVDRIQTKSITVDTFFSRNNIDASRYNLWNFDIQGAELLALKGSIENIRHVKAIYLEVNTKELYKDCALISDIDEFLSKFGFKRVLTNISQHCWGDALYITKNDSIKEFMVNISGGLGNKLFRLAGGLNLANQYNRKLVVDWTKQDEYMSPHSDINYFQTIFKNFNIDSPSCQSTKYVDIDSYTYDDCKELLEDEDEFLIESNSYFQHWKYITDEFCSRLHFNTSIVDKYTGINNKVFIHIRGGDYLYLTHKLPDLTNYYKAALLEFPEDTEYIIFTNDIRYTETRDWLPKKYTISTENDIDSLYLMTQCKGGITANSTFSWWGAFLNRKRKLTLPSHYLRTAEYGTSFHFPEATVIHV